MSSEATRSILSIQSSVAYGHVGNAAATLPLQRLGFEVWPIATVVFSNHPGHGAFRGEVCAPALVGALIEGIAERGILAQVDAVLSGYLGTAGTGEVVHDAVGRVKTAWPRALYCCDPVIGDRASGVYVEPGLAELFRDRVLPLADLATPNHFELEQLSGRAVGTIEEARAAAATLMRSGPRILLVTSFERADRPAATSEILLVEDDAAWLLATPLLPIAAHGAGDALAALFLGHYLRGGDAPAALGAAASSIFGILEATAAAGSRELLLVAAQEEIVTPRRRFSPALL
jgi:pyridoxine kinase